MISYRSRGQREQKNNGHLFQELYPETMTFEHVN